MGHQAVAVVRPTQRLEKAGMEGLGQVLSSRRAIYFPTESLRSCSEAPVRTGWGEVGRDLPGFAPLTFIVNLVVDLVVMATGNHRQLRVHHVTLPGVVLPCGTVRITEAMEQPAGCVAHFMDESIPDSILQEEKKETVNTGTASLPVCHPSSPTPNPSSQKAIWAAHAGRCESHLHRIPKVNFPSTSTRFCSWHRAWAEASLFGAAPTCSSFSQDAARKAATSWLPPLGTEGTGLGESAWRGNQ